MDSSAISYLKHLPGKPLSLGAAAETVPVIMDKLTQVFLESDEDQRLQTKQDVTDIVQSTRRFLLSCNSLVKKMRKSRHVQGTLDTSAFVRLGNMSSESLHSRIPPFLLNQLLLVRLGRLIREDFIDLCQPLHERFHLGFVNILIYSDFTVVRDECMSALLLIEAPLPDNHQAQSESVVSDLLLHDKVVPRLRAAIGTAYLQHSASLATREFTLMEKLLEKALSITQELKRTNSGSLSQQDWIILHGFAETMACVVRIRVKITTDLIVPLLTFILHYVSNQSSVFWNMQDVIDDFEADADHTEEMDHSLGTGEIIKSCCWRTLTACIAALSDILMQNQVYGLDILPIFDTLQHYIQFSMVHVRHWGVSQYLMAELKRICKFMLDTSHITAQEKLESLLRTLATKFLESKPNPRKDQRYIGYTRMMRVMLSVLPSTHAKTLCQEIIVLCEKVIFNLNYESHESLSKENSISVLLAFTQDTHVCYMLSLPLMLTICLEAIKQNIPGAFVFYGALIPKLSKDPDEMVCRTIASSLVQAINAPFYPATTQILPWLILFKFIKPILLVPALNECNSEEVGLLQWLDQLNSRCSSAHIRILAAEVLCHHLDAETVQQLIRFRAESARSCNEAHGTLMLIQFVLPSLSSDAQRTDILQTAASLIAKFKSCVPLRDLLSHVEL